MRKLDGGGQIKTAFKAAYRRAGIIDLTPHGCRHTWATWHDAANRDLVGLMHLGGWRSEKMVLRYAHMNDRRASLGKIREAADAERRNTSCQKCLGRMTRGLAKVAVGVRIPSPAQVKLLCRPSPSIGMSAHYPFRQSAPGEGHSDRSRRHGGL